MKKSAPKFRIIRRVKSVRSGTAIPNRARRKGRHKRKYRISEILGRTPESPEFYYEGRRNHRCGGFRTAHESGSPEAASCLERHSYHHSYDPEIRSLPSDQLHYCHRAQRICGGYLLKLSVVYSKSTILYKSGNQISKVMKRNQKE